MSVYVLMPWTRPTQRLELRDLRALVEACRDDVAAILVIDSDSRETVNLADFAPVDVAQ